MPVINASRTENDFWHSDRGYCLNLTGIVADKVENQLDAWYSGHVHQIAPRYSYALACIHGMSHPSLWGQRFVSGKGLQIGREGREDCPRSRSRAILENKLHAWKWRENGRRSSLCVKWNWEPSINEVCKISHIWSPSCLHLGVIYHNPSFMAEVKILFLPALSVHTSCVNVSTQRWARYILCGD